MSCLKHVVTLVHLLPFWRLESVELAEEIKGNDCIDVDDYASHEDRHTEL